MTDEPVRGLPRIAFKLRTEGPGWIVKRLAAEAVQPTTPPGRALHIFARRSINGLATVPRLLARAAFTPPEESARTLFAFYDLKVAPITFDFLWFLASADLERRRHGLDQVHIVFVPGLYFGLRRERDDYEEVIDADARRERVQNILIQSCPLLPSCKAVTQAASRAEARFLRSFLARYVYPRGYEPALPVHTGPGECLAAARAGDRSIAILRATKERLRDVDRWLAARTGGRRVVAITMRGYDYMIARNSNIAAWAQFARSLDAQRYVPVFIPDTDETIVGLAPELKEFLSFPEAAWHVGLRMALYERAFFNIGVNTGPMGLCWLNPATRYATLKMVTPAVPQTTIGYFRKLGFRPNHSLPFATPLQELVWEDDNVDAIKHAFARAVALIERAEGAA